MGRVLVRVAALVTLVVIVGASSGCAYYNTFYLARKYYERGAAGLPYPVEKPSGIAGNEYAKSIEYSKKLLSQYPDSKWVDDAYLLWARALLGRDDPLQTVNLLEVFGTRFPESPLRNEAVFYLGVGFRQARKYRQAVDAFDKFLAAAPKDALVPYAHLERGRALVSLERHADAAVAVTQVLDRFPKSPLQHQARMTRAEAYLAGGQHALAQQDFKELGLRSRTDEERLGYLLREAECLEAARDYDAELALLEDALSHEVAPLKPDSTSHVQVLAAGYDRYGRLLMRIGSTHLLAGRIDQALAAYQRIVEDYPRTPLGAEAQYRIGYAYETFADDFELARQEYEKVKEHSGGTGFGQQAQQRLQNLNRLAQFRQASGDTAQRHSEAGFLLAEQYLFQLDKPERAAAEYERIAQDLAGSPLAGKALVARAWVMRTKLDRASEADSILWRVVREYPATEAQLAARDYLENSGATVPASLIKMPVKPAPPADTTAAKGPAPLLDAARSIPALQIAPDSSAAMPPPVARSPADSIRRAMADSLRSAARRDSAARAAELLRLTGVDSIVVAPPPQDTPRAPGDVEQKP